MSCLWHDVTVLCRKDSYLSYKDNVAARLADEKTLQGRAVLMK
jgi:hypothetical protein